MIKGFVQGQTLKLSQTRVVADTIDYLIAKFTFQGEDWRGLDKWMHLRRGEEIYAVRLTDDKTKKEDHLNLGAGAWELWLHGSEQKNGEVATRITTNVCTFDVEASGALSGDVLPATPAGVGEQLAARLDALEQRLPKEISVLPAASVADNGKILQVVNGQWTPADAPSGGGSGMVVDAEFSETSSNPVQNKVITAAFQEASVTLAQLGGAVEALGDRVPAASAKDNGKILQVVNGQWTPADAPSGGGTDIVVDAEFSETSSNPVQNKVITAVLQEASVTLAQLGGAVEALGDRVPAASVADNGKILQVVNGQWAPADAPSGGGADIVVDAELSGTSENPVQNKVVTAVVQEASMALTQLGGAVEQLGQRVMPEVSAEDNGKMFSVVNGQWAVVDVANSPIKAYIDDYINEALGGDY